MRPRRAISHAEIAATLGAEILSGQRPPGSRMPSADELFERFGVSRAVLREVTKTLAAKGMITAKSRVGTTVLPPEHWNWFDPDVLAWRVMGGLDEAFVRHLGQVRNAVEPAGAALAAEHRTAEHIALMRAALDAMARAGSDRRAFVQADLDFHVAVAAASGNPMFRSLAGVVETALVASFSHTTPIDSDALVAIEADHAAIADAIEARDPEAAARAMRRVIDVGLSRVIGKQN